MADKYKTEVAIPPEVTDEQLEEVLRTRRLAKLEPMIAEWEAGNDKQRKLAKAIQSVAPDWKPETLGDKILAWLAEQEEPVSKEAIVAVFGKGTGLALSNLDASVITVKAGKYSATPAK